MQRYTMAPPLRLRPAGESAAPPAHGDAPAVGPDGRVAGIDGMLDQVSGALVRQVKTEILPVLQQDKALQATIGEAAGREVAGPLWTLATIAGIYVGWRILRGA